MFFGKQMFFFLDMFMNYFPEIHRSVPCKITINLLYFKDIYDVKLCEKMLAEVRLIHAEQMSLYIISSF